MGPAGPPVHPGNVQRGHAGQRSPRVSWKFQDVSWNFQDGAGSSLDGPVIDIRRTRGGIPRLRGRVLRPGNRTGLRAAMIVLANLAMQFTPRGKREKSQ